MPQVTTFEYVVSQKPSVAFSLELDHSDYLQNEIVLSELIATLVKVDNSGHYTPFLAKNWSISEDQKTWTFDLREDYRAEDGTVINAYTFSEDLKITLAKLSPKSDQFWFSKLKGWQRFATGGGSLEGIKVDGNKIRFEFLKRPERLLNFLRMPYFGYWGGNRNFALAKSFVSSGGSSLLVFSGKRVELKGRDTGNKVAYSIRQPSESDFKNSRMVVLTSQEESEVFAKYEGHTSTLPPEILEVLIISPVIGSPLRDRNSRAIFVRQLRAFYREKEFRTSDIFVDKFFGLELVKSSFSEENTDMSNLTLRRPLRILAHRSWEEGVSDPLMDTLHDFLKSRGIRYTTTPFSHLEGRNPYANDYFDLRISGVSTGSKFSQSVVEMMFCTTLGVSFPDPNKSVCKLVEGYGDDESADADFYTDKLNQVIAEENYVVPLKRYGLVLNFSPAFNVKTIPEATIFINFEKLKVRD